MLPGLFEKIKRKLTKFSAHFCFRSNFDYFVSQTSFSYSMTERHWFVPEGEAMFFAIIKILTA